LTGFDPSFDREPSVACIDRSEDSLRKFGAGLREQCWIQKRGRSNRYDIRARFERNSHGIDIPQSAAHVQATTHCRTNRANRVEITRLSRDRPIEVDDMN